MSQLPKIAVVGAGIMGSHHARVLHQLGCLHSVVDSNIELARTKATRYDVPAFADAHSFADSPHGVVVATPTPFHFAIAQSCAERGIHLLIEKPLCQTVQDAERLLCIVDECSVLLGVGYIERYNSAYRALQQLVCDEAFGQITSVNVKRVGGVPRSADNVIIDLMTHDFNLLMALFNRAPQHLYVAQNNHNNIVDNAQALLDFGEASAICETNWISPIKVRRIEVIGTAAYCDVDLIAQRLTYHTANRVLDVQPFSAFKDFVKLHGPPTTQRTVQFQKEPLMAELSCFVDAIMGKSNELVSGDDALRTLKLTLQAAYGN